MVLPAAAQNGAANGTAPNSTARPKVRTAQRDAPVATNTRPAAPAREPADAPPSKPLPPPGKTAPQGSPQTRPMSPPKGFELSESQQKLLDAILIKWEKQSDKVKTYISSFDRWEYDPTWGPKQFDFQTTKGAGKVLFSAPDKGEFVIDELWEFDPKKVDYVKKAEGLDHWVCNGEAIFEFNHPKKQLVERRLPPQLRGKAISDGPLPFIFGAKADQLKRRYWMRDATPKEEIGKTIWLEAMPKFQQDAANFQRATVVLNEADFMPFALRIFLPGGTSDTAYKFKNNKVNGTFAKFEFTAPRLSAAQVIGGWKHVIEDESAEDPQNEQPAPPPTAKQAKRPAATGPRK